MQERIPSATNAWTGVAAIGRREFALGGLSVLLSSAALPAMAQQFPSHPLRFVITFAPGGPNDVLARAVAERLETHLHQKVIVENRPGAGGAVGLQAAMRMPADGYTLVLLQTIHSVEQAFRKDPGFDVRKDFIPIASLSTVPQVLVGGPALEQKTFPEIVAFLKANPGKLGCATAAPNQVQYLRAAAGVDIAIVPYPGAAPSILDVIGGRVAMALPPLSLVTEHIQTGTLRAIAVTERSRIPELPNVPTIAETVPGFSLDIAYGLAVAAGTPDDAVNTLKRAAAAVVEADEYKSFIKSRAFGPPLSLPDFTSALTSEFTKYEKLIKDLNLPRN